MNNFVLEELTQERDKERVSFSPYQWFSFTCRSTSLRCGQGTSPLLRRGGAPKDTGFTSLFEEIFTGYLYQGLLCQNQKKKSGRTTMSLVPDVCGLSGLQ